MPEKIYRNPSVISNARKSSLVVRSRAPPWQVSDVPASRLEVDESLNAQPVSSEGSFKPCGPRR